MANKNDSVSPLVWTTVKRKVKDLVPFEHNPRKMTEEQVQTLTDSINEFGLVEIPAIDTDNTLIAGHMRTRVMQALGRGEEEIDVRMPNRKLTESEFKRYNVRSNQNRGMFDYELLAGLFEESELLELGFSEKELDMVTFPELEDMSFTDATDKVKGNTVELVFESEEDEKEFARLLNLLKEQYGLSLSSSLLAFLKENVGATD